MTWPGNTLHRSTFRKPDASFQRALDIADTIAFNACPGPDRCHGPLAWCDECGDVDEMCNCIECDRHRCARCNSIVRSDDRDAVFLEQLCKECS